MRARLAALGASRTGSSRSCLSAPGRRAWSAGGGCWTRPALYDAVATMDTVTLLRVGDPRAAAGRATPALEAELRRAAGARRRLPDGGQAGLRLGRPRPRARRWSTRWPGRHALLAALEGRELRDAVDQAAALLATVVGQDLDEDADGVLRIARRVAKDRVISTVDPEARHGHKTAAVALTATRATSRSTPTARSSPRPRSPPATSAMPPRRRPARRRSADVDAEPAEHGHDRARTRGSDAAERPSAWPSTATAPTAPGALLASARARRRDRSCARSSRPSRPADVHQGPVRRSTSTPAPSPARPARSRRCGASQDGQIAPLRRGLRGLPAGRAVHHLQAGADHHRPATKPQLTARPRPPDRPRPGRPTTAPPGPRSNARSPTSCAAATAGAAPACAATPSRRRLQPARRRGQPRPARHARADPPTSTGWATTTA